MNSKLNRQLSLNHSTKNNFISRGREEEECVYFCTIVNSFLAHLHSEGELLSYHFVRRPSVPLHPLNNYDGTLSPQKLLISELWNSCWSKIQDGRQAAILNIRKLDISLTNKDIKLWFSLECSCWHSASVECQRVWRKIESEKIVAILKLWTLTY